MHNWSKEHAKFVGRVIFANFLKLPLERYKNIIEEMESPPLFKKLSRGGGNLRDNGSVIIIKRLSGAGISQGAPNKSSKAIAEIVKSGKGFSIRYAYEGFNKIYTICGTQRPKFFYKLRRISSRNELTHTIIKGIIEHQGSYLNIGDPIDLVPFSQVQLTKRLNGSKLPKIDISWVSRLVNRLSVIIPSGEERTLRSFFPTQKDINKRLIKQLLDKENEDIESGRLKRPLTDNQIRAKLESEYEVKLSRHSIGHCRKDMGIPPARRRLAGYKYPPLSANFSLLYPFTVGSVQNNAPANSGIYELRFKGKEIEYPKGKTNVIYIGSAKNIRKRLKEHLRGNNKNSHIRHFLKRLDCSFRYIRFSKNWKGEEGRLYSLFVSTYQAPPKCNQVKP